MSDAERQAIRAVQKGDTRAFGTLYDVYAKPIYRFIYFKTHHQSTAEDITSQTFAKALERIQSFDEAKGTFSGWLYQIARHTVTDHYRSVKQEIPIEDAWDIGSDSHIERDTDTLLHVEKVKIYLAKLSATERDIITMRVWQEMSYQEIAEALGKSEGSCKMAYARGLEKLRSFMPLAAYLALIMNI